MDSRPQHERFPGRRSFLAAAFRSSEDRNRALREDLELGYASGEISISFIRLGWKPAHLREVSDAAIATPASASRAEGSG